MKPQAAQHPSQTHSETIAPIRALYRLHARGEAATYLAQTIAYEQTVELPQSLVSDPALLENVVAQVASVEPDPDDKNCSLAWLAYPQNLAGAQLSQLVNLLYGNVSMLPGIRLVDVELPNSLLQQFEGPGYGVDGLRALTGVYGRPLLATALKPRGLAVAQLAAMARDFASGGGDIVKDDQNLVDGNFEAFKARVQACFEAVHETNAQTRRRCLYFPHLAGPAEQLDERAEFLRRLGVTGVLACPMILGLDTARALTRRYGLVYMAHPALSGGFTGDRYQGVNLDLLLGTLFRLGGADISVFPNHGGRFAYSREQCAAIQRRLVEPLGAVKAALPAPAGGMGFDKLAAMGADYGKDAVFLIGGGLQANAAMRENTARFLDRIRERFDERLEIPADSLSACEAPATKGALKLLDRIAFEESFEWAGRPSEAYKDAETLPFKGVRRVELIGKGGERTHFELRYFEIQPGGYTSLEKHLHTHVLIGARGKGVMIAGEQSLPVKPLDIAYIAPLKVHQLRNPGDTPFGFFCIVDRERDRPMQP